MATPATSTGGAGSREGAVVVVIGSGLAGLATAVGLARMAEAEAEAAEARRPGPAPGAPALTVEVVEKRSAYDARGAAFGLAPNGLKALEELCPDAARGLVGEGVYMEATGGYLLPWYRVRDALLQHLKQQQQRSNSAATIRLRMGWDLTSIEQIGFDGDGASDPPPARTSAIRGVRAVFSNGQSLEGSVLVAADGIRSRVRRVLGLAPALSPPASRVWRGHASVPPSSALHPRLEGGGIVPLGTVAAGRSTFSVFSFHAKTPGSVAWTVASKEPDVAPGASVLDVLGPHLASLGEDRSELIREVFRLTEPQADLVAAYDNTVVELPGDEGGGWGGRGRVVLVGDAAHALRPATGQGGSMAFEDALLLCRKLRQVWWSAEGRAEEEEEEAPPGGGGADPVAEALREFENERLPRVRRIWDTEWRISEASYNARPGDERKPPALDDEYKAWVYGGI